MKLSFAIVLKRFQAAMGQFLYDVLLDLDEDGNVFVIGLIVVFMKVLGFTTVPAAGNAHYTISQTLAEMRERKMRVGCIGCRILTFCQYWIVRMWDYIAMKPFVDPGDHCTNAMKGVPEEESAG